LFVSIPPGLFDERLEFAPVAEGKLDFFAPIFRDDIVDVVFLSQLEKWRVSQSRADDELRALLGIIKAKADAGGLTGKRDYALPLFYLTTGMRRGEVISLRRRDVEIEGEAMIVSGRVEGGIIRTGKSATRRRGMRGSITCGRADVHACSGMMDLWGGTISPESRAPRSLPTPSSRI